MTWFRVVGTVVFVALTSCGKLAKEVAKAGGGTAAPTSGDQPAQSPAPASEDAVAESSPGPEESPIPGVDVCGGSAHDNSAPEIRLKSAELIAKALRDTFGPGKDVNFNNARENLIATYKSQLGTAEGLSFGDTYADRKTADLEMTGYMLALSIVAINAARRCESERDAELCKCDTPDTAAAMLTRALPWRRSCAEGDDMVLRMAKLCKENYVQGVTALVSSVAFALRN